MYFRLLNLLLFMLAHASLSFAEAPPCFENDPCGQIGSVYLTPSGIEKMISTTIDTAIDSDKLKESIPNIDPAPVSLPSNTKLCMEMFNDKKRCDKICTSEEIEKLELTDAWKLCPGSVPKALAFGEGSIREAATPVPISLDIDNFNISDLKMGKSDVKVRSNGGLDVCMDIERLKINTDVKIKASESGHLVFGANKLGLSLGKNSTNNMANVCFDVTLNDDGKSAKSINIVKRNARGTLSQTESYP